MIAAHIGDDREDGHSVEDLLPGSDAVGLGCHGTAELGGELPGVDPDLQDVITECQQGGQGKGCHKQRDEAKLDH